MATIQEKITAMEAEHRLKVAQLKAADEAIQARKVAALIRGKRSADTRRKILAGSLVLEMMEKDEKTKAHFNARLDAFLTRADDRALFGLPEKPKSIPGGATSDSTKM